MTLKRLSEADYTEHWQKVAREVFADHVITDTGERSWYVSNPKNKAYWFEIVALRGGYLLVNGDIGALLFGTYRDSVEPLALVRWIGNSSLSYAKSKAAIGFGSKTLLEQVHKDVWMDDVLCHIESEHGEIDTAVDPLPCDEWLRDLICDVAINGDPETAIRDAGTDAQENYDHVEGWNWGIVPSVRMVYAHEAVRKLVQLLGETA